MADLEMGLPFGFSLAVKNFLHVVVVEVRNAVDSNDWLDVQLRRKRRESIGSHSKQYRRASE